MIDNFTMRILYFFQFLYDLFSQSLYNRYQPPSTIYHIAEEGNIGKTVHLIPVENEFEKSKKMV
jgi:hypothetical protein